MEKETIKEENEELTEQKKEIKVEDLRNRVWTIAIHKHDINNPNWIWNEKKALENIKDFCNNGYDTIWYIKHYANEENEHTHFVIKTKNARKLKQIAKLLELDSEHYSWVQMVKNVKSILDYLIHKNNPEKVQYNKSDVITIGQFQYEDMTKEFMNRTQIFNKLRYEKDSITELLDNPNIETSEIKSMYYLAERERKINMEKKQQIIEQLEARIEKQYKIIEQLNLKNECYEEILNKIAFNIHKGNIKELNEELANTIDYIIYESCETKEFKK